MNEFEKLVIEEIKHMYPDAEVTCTEIRKNNNIVYKALLIRESGINICPTIYLNHFYVEWKKGQSIVQICTKISDLYEKNKRDRDFDITELIDFEKVRNRICYKIVNFERNKELLEQIPYIKILDLAITFFVSMEISEDGISSTLIRDSFLDAWNTNVDEIWKIAQENTPRLFAPDTMNMNQALCKLFCKDQILDDSIEMYVVTNRERINGASAILYNGLLKQLALKLNMDFYIIPSSIHEVILLPYEEGERQKLEEIVEQVNDKEVSDEEILSYRVYHYSREQDKILL